MTRLSIAGDSLSDLVNFSWPIRMEEFLQGKKIGGKEIEIVNFGRGGAIISASPEEATKKG